MFKNYIKIALRNIRRHKGYSFINIVGLAIGMACCILILLWVQDELSYDPLGKIIKANNQYDFLVTGVMKNVPRNSHLQFDFLIPFIFGRELNYYQFHELDYGPFR